MTFANPSGGSIEANAAYVKRLIALLGDRDPISVLTDGPREVERAIAPFDDDQLRQPEAPGKWSAIEVVQHLADSELIYGYRMRLIVAHDRPTLPGYDQDAWTSRLGYRHVERRHALDQLDSLRTLNLRWLEGLDDATRARVGFHDERGEESVDHIVRLLAAHDLVHLAQLDRLRAALLPHRP